jgi:predicted kinase
MELQQAEYGTPIFDGRRRLMARLIVFAGLPASGKSTIPRAVAERTGAVWLRVDSMDQAIWAAGTAAQDLQDWTYRAAAAVQARDYHPWDREHRTIDTAGRSIEACVETALGAL